MSKYLTFNKVYQVKSAVLYLKHKLHEFLHFELSISQNEHSGLDNPNLSLYTFLFFA